MGPEIEGPLRIGELSRRVGVSEHVLRAWEHRYRLLDPIRSDGGFRLYSADDEARIRRMQQHMAGGLSAAQAARAALAEKPSVQGRMASVGVSRSDLPGVARNLVLALDNLDEPGAQAMLDRVLSDYTVEAVLRDVILPYLRGLGERWAVGEISIAQEHFASNVLRGRLTSLARGWGNGSGPAAVLACAPGEQHDLPLLMFGIALNRLGWRIIYLGVDTPLEVLWDNALQARPDLVVVALADSARLRGQTRALRALAGAVPLAIAGGGATSSLAERTGTRLLSGDPVTAAQRVQRR